MPLPLPTILTNKPTTEPVGYVKSSDTSGSQIKILNK